MGEMRCYIILLLVVLATVAVSQSSAASCTINSYNADAVTAAQKDCTEIIIDGINVPAGVQLDLTKLQNGAKLRFRGTITWEYAEWDGPLVKIKGTNVEVSGDDGHVLDGRGQLWWDGLGGNGGVKKPHFLKVIVESSHVHNLYLKNAPVQAFSVNGCYNSVIEYITVDDKDGDTQGGHNTDAFNVNSSHNVTIQHSTVYNQDDCMAMNSGYDTFFLDNYCSGGHGISIGSVGNGAIVKGVTVRNCKIVDSDNGVRIKTIYGSTGSVSDVIYENIELKNIHKYGIVIQGDYGSSGGEPSGGVPITNLVVKNVKGTVDKKGVNIYILVENASDWHWSDIDVSGGNQKKTCKGIPEGAGVSC